MKNNLTACRYGSKNYDVGNLSVLVALRGAKADVDGPGTRVVPVTCKDCGEVRLYSVDVLKIPT